MGTDTDRLSDPVMCIGCTGDPGADGYKRRYQKLAVASESLAALAGSDRWNFMCIDVWCIWIRKSDRIHL